MAYVADGKDAGHARLERERSASQRRPGLSELLACELDVGADEAMLVEATPESQPVAGSAPMKQKRPRHACSCTSPAGPTSEIDSSTCSPSRRVTSVLPRTVMFGLASSRSTR